MRRWLPHPLTLLSAFLIVFAFAPWDFSFLIWIALLPWLWAIDGKKDLKAKLGESAWLGFLMSVGGFYWVAYALRQNAGAPWVIAVIGMLGFSIFNQLQFFLFTPFLHATRTSRPLVQWIFLTFTYTAIDAYYPKMFKDTLGHSLYASPFLRQFADVGGAQILTLTILSVNLACFLGLKLYLRGSRALALRYGALAAAMLVLLTGYGVMRDRELNRLMVETPRRVQAAGIQANIGDFEKVAAETGIRGAADRILKTHLDLSEKALELSPRPQFLIWPETSYSSTFRHPVTVSENERDQIVTDFSKNHGIPVLFGGYDTEAGKDFNTLFYLHPSPHEAFEHLDYTAYRKNILLFLGEYIPFADQSPTVSEWFPQVGNFGRGIGPRMIPIFLADGTVVKTGPVICYEALFPEYIRAATRAGSELMINITNDSWFGAWGEPYLHLALTVFRSIEVRVPQLRVTNTGISALVLPDGTMSARTGIFQPEILNVTIPLIAPQTTVFLRLGDWVGLFSLGLALSLGLVNYAFRRIRA